MTVVFEVDELIEGIVVSRPSKINKSPYLADVLINGKEYMCHSPSLGCSGYIVPGVKCLLTPKKTTTKTVSKYSLDVLLGDKYNNIQEYIGVNPNYSNTMVYNAVTLNLIKDIPPLIELKKEVTVGDSRLDLVGKTKDKTYYIEVKSVPCADYIDVIKKDRLKADVSSYKHNEKIGIFPYDTKRSTVKITISPRALKHVEELEKIIKNDKNANAYLIFTVQRSDCKYFQISNLDPIYKAAVFKASNNGVNIKAYQLNWKENKVHWGKELIVRL